MVEIGDILPCQFEVVGCQLRVLAQIVDNNGSYQGVQIVRIHDDLPIEAADPVK